MNGFRGYNSLNNSISSVFDMQPCYDGDSGWDRRFSNGHTFVAMDEKNELLEKIQSLKTDFMAPLQRSKRLLEDVCEVKYSSANSEKNKCYEAFIDCLREHQSNLQNLNSRRNLIILDMQNKVNPLSKEDQQPKNLPSEIDFNEYKKNLKELEALHAQLIYEDKVVRIYSTILPKLKSFQGSLSKSCEAIRRYKKFKEDNLLTEKEVETFFHRVESMVSRFNQDNAIAVDLEKEIINILSIKDVNIDLDQMRSIVLARSWKAICETLSDTAIQIAQFGSSCGVFNVKTLYQWGLFSTTIGVHELKASVVYKREMFC